jgi:hypothetical protein
MAFSPLGSSHVLLGMAVPRISTITYSGLFRVGRGERSAQGLRPLSRPLSRSSRGRAGALVGWDGCEVRLPVCPVAVPSPPGVFLPAPLFLNGTGKHVRSVQVRTRRPA